MKRLLNFLTLSLLFSMVVPCFGMEKNEEIKYSPQNEVTKDGQSDNLIESKEFSYQEPTRENISRGIENINTLKAYIETSQVPESVSEYRRDNIKAKIIASLEIFREVPDECIAHMQRLDSETIRELITVAISLQSKKMIFNLLSFFKNKNINLIDVLDDAILEALDCEAELSFYYLTEYIIVHNIEIDVSSIMYFAWDTENKNLFEFTLRTENNVLEAFFKNMSCFNYQFPPFFEQLSFENQRKLTEYILRLQAEGFLVFVNDNDNQ